MIHNAGHIIQGHPVSQTLTENLNRAFTLRRLPGTMILVQTSLSKNCDADIGTTEHALRKPDTIK